MTAEEIAAGLTDAQRRALIRHKENQRWGDPHHTHLPKWKIGRELRMLGLIDFISPTSSTTAITPLGQQVRSILEGQQR